MKKIVSIMGALALLLMLVYIIYPWFQKLEPVSQEKIFKIIEEKYPNSKKLQMALKQDVEWEIRIANGDAAYDELGHLSDNANDCVYAVSPNNYDEPLSWTEEIVFNNYQRLYLYEKYNHHFSGKILEHKIIGIRGCNFDTENLPN